MDKKWQELYDAAKQVLKHEMFLKIIAAGGVSAAVESVLRQNICWSVCRYGMYIRRMC